VYTVQTKCPTLILMILQTYLTYSCE